MLRVIEWFCDWADEIGDRIDYWTARSPSRYLLVHLVGVSFAVVAIIILVAIFICLYLGRLPNFG